MHVRTSAPQGCWRASGEHVLSKEHLRQVSERRFWGLAPGDLLHDVVYRRLWTSILFSAVGGQVTLLALPLTAALLLHATPIQMGLLTAAEILPFALFSLPTGVWLDHLADPGPDLYPGHGARLFRSGAARVSGPGGAA